MKDRAEYVLIEKQDRVFAQGDVFFVRVDAMPPGCTPATSQVIAHSETGHHHVAQQARVFMHPTDTERGYLVYEALARGEYPQDMPRIEHTRPDKAHRTYVLDGSGVIEFRRQRQYTPEGYEIRNVD